MEAVRSDNGDEYNGQFEYYDKEHEGEKAKLSLIMSTFNVVMSEEVHPTQVKANGARGLWYDRDMKMKA